jgi:hypothetical protein
MVQASDIQSTVSAIVKSLKANKWTALNIDVHPNGLAFTNATHWTVADNAMGWNLEQAREIMAAMPSRYRVRIYRYNRPLEVHAKPLHH